MKMNFKYITILFILLSFSCKNSEANKPILYIEEKEIETPIITDEFKLEFLNKILSNKKDSLLFPIEKEPTITFEHQFRYTNERSVIYHQITGKSATFSEYLTFLFKEKTDSLFVKNQFNKITNLNDLNSLGHKFINWEQIYKYDKDYNIVNLVPKDSMEFLFKESKQIRTLNFYSLFFNKKLNKALVPVHTGLNNDIDILFTKKGDKWLSKKIISRNQNIISN